MEILEHGITYIKKKCDKCKCEFLYVEKDIQTATWTNEYYKYVKCPECNEIIVIEH